jgi:Ca2+-binding EF-hand superfamily protein
MKLGDHSMISRRSVLTSLTVAGLIAGAAPAFGKSKRSNPLQVLDPDNDGTVDLAEAKKAGSDLFDKLDRDHDGTLDKRELAGRLSAKDLAAADLDHDGTLTKDEYLAVVEQRFNAANSDSDGTLDAKELGTKAGHSLLRLLK